MYVDSSPVTTRRSAGTRRLRNARRETTPQTANATAGAGRLRPVSAAARRIRLADAIISQWLLEQLPSDHRHALRSASDPRREHPV
jgi:hypothetical protein